MVTVINTAYMLHMKVKRANQSSHQQGKNIFLFFSGGVSSACLAAQSHSLRAPGL